MNAGDMKIVELLRTAYAQEMGVVRTLQAHADVAHDGSYKQDLQHHLTETVRHARLIRERLGQLGYLEDENLVQRSIGWAQQLITQGMALAKAPWDILRGKGDVAETMLKNAQDEAMTEAKEIAVYLALEHVARRVGDTQTAELAQEIRSDEEAMLKKLGDTIPDLAREMVNSQVVNASEIEAAN